jgi:hypothetical protein
MYHYAITKVLMLGESFPVLWCDKAVGTWDFHTAFCETTGNAELYIWKLLVRSATNHLQNTETVLEMRNGQKMGFISLKLKFETSHSAKYLPTYVQNHMQVFK